MILNNKKKILFILFFVVNVGYSQTDDINYKSLYKDTDYSTALKIATSGNSYDFMGLRKYIGALNVMIKGTNDEELIQKQIKLVDNLINSSQISQSILNSTYEYKDKFKSWIVHKADNGNKATINKEVSLFESYTFFYVAEFLYILKENGWIEKSVDNKKWWNETVQFVEQNVWTKWRSRSYKIFNKKYNHYFLRNRTHMGSHWAGIAMYLGEITNNEQIVKQTNEVQRQYDMLLKRNLQLKKGAYVWNSTYDDVRGTDAGKGKANVIQDGSHGNHVVAYVVAAYELGNKNWTKKDLKRLSKTVTRIMYNKKTNSFADKVDGTVHESRPGWGNFVGDGWVKLAKYDKEAAKIFKQFSTNDKLLKKYKQELQYNTTILKYCNQK